MRGHQISKFSQIILGEEGQEDYGLFGTFSISMAPLMCLSLEFYKDPTVSCRDICKIILIYFFLMNFWRIFDILQIMHF